MKRISFKGRLLLRKILTGLSLGAVTLMFQACYGPPRASLTGTVKSSDTDEPISGIKVSVKSEDWYSVSTNNCSEFELWVDEGRRRYTILFQDVDGLENGGFQNKEVTWRSGDGPLHVTLDPKVR